MQFSEIKGQEKAIHILQCAIANRHLAHAYLFTGPDGIGKKKTALALAQYLNCDAPDETHFTSCGHCPSCLQSECGSHPGHAAPCRCSSLQSLAAPCPRQSDCPG